MTNLFQQSTHTDDLNIEILTLVEIVLPELDATNRDEEFSP